MTTKRRKYLFQKYNDLYLEDVYDRLDLVEKEADEASKKNRALREELRKAKRLILLYRPR